MTHSQVRSHRRSGGTSSIDYRRGVSLETLEGRTLFSTINVAQYGAIANDGVDDSAAIQRAINSAGNGDVVVFGAGTYNVNKALNVKSGITLQGVEGTKLSFSVGSGNFGLDLNGDATNVRIENLDIDGGGIFLGHGSKYSNITIVNNKLRANGTPGVKQTIGSDNVLIQGNTFHDYENYGVILYHVDRLNLNNNTFLDVQQAGHILDPGADCNIKNNLATGLTRMMFEVQRMGSRTANNLLVEGNVAYDWKSPFRDSFGLSIVADSATNTIVRNNYLRANLRAGGSWNPQTQTDGQGQRFGYGIEFGAQTGSVTGNIIGGLFANDIVISGGSGAHTNSILVADNQMYGTPMWTAFITTEAPPVRPPIDQNNLKDPNFSHMPAPPTIPGSPLPDPTIPGDGGTDPVNDSPTDLAAVAYSSSRIDLNWRDNSNIEFGYIVERSLDGTTFTEVARRPSDTESQADIGLPSSTKFYYRVCYYDERGNSAYSNVASATTKAKTALPTDDGNTPTRPGGNGTNIPTTPTLPGSGGIGRGGTRE